MSVGVLASSGSFIELYGLLLALSVDVWLLWEDWAV